MTTCLQNWRGHGAVVAGLIAIALSFGSASAQTTCPTGTSGQQSCSVIGLSTGSTPQGCAASNILPSLPATPPSLAQFTQQLATALNLPPTTVQQALTAQSSQTLVDLLPKPAHPIAAAAALLGVTQQQLTSAVQAADQTMEPPNPVTGSATGAIIRCSGQNGNSRPDPTAFFQDVAQQLGQSFTGQQVESAFASTAPQPPDPSQVQAVEQQWLGNLATTLGVNVDTLTQAFSTSGIPAGCLPVTSSTSLQPPVGSDSGSGPIFIPLPAGSGSSGSNGGAGGTLVAFRGPGLSASASGSLPIICMKSAQPS